MRNAIIGLAVLCYGAALVVAAVSSRLPAPAAERTIRTTVAGLAREQAADREAVVELQATVKRLQDELARRPTPGGGEPAGRTVGVLGASLLADSPGPLSPAAREAVRRLLPEIQADPERVVAVEGHTDSRPIRAPAEKLFKDNAGLSLLRARAVAAALESEGVAPARIRVKAWGDTRPLAPNDSAAGRELNRRVEVRLLPPGQEP